MPNSYNKIWIHAIWATKERQDLLTTDIEKQVYDFMYKQLTDMGSPVRIINGMPDHVHCLFLLNKQKSISETIKQLKGSTSFFINELKLTEEKFVWQAGYAAYSVSESVVEKVHQYIKNQKKHHAQKSFDEEYNGYLKIYGFQNE